MKQKSTAHLCCPLDRHDIVTIYYVFPFCAACYSKICVYRLAEPSTLGMRAGH